VAVHTPTAVPTLPCGACRQVIHEFGPKALVVAVGNGRTRVESSLDALLPRAFGPKNLK
jgi:cytidine deaminase